MISRTLIRRAAGIYEGRLRVAATKGGASKETAVHADRLTMLGLDFASGGRLSRGRTVPCVELILRS